ncbi:MAG: hypothetical protein VW127_06070 [Flavobacteriaceae bacterium]
MMRFFTILVMFFCFFSCKEKTSNAQQTVEKVIDSLSINTPDYSSQVIQFTPEFIEDNEINQWTDFKKFKDAMEDMSKLNPEGIIVFISDLYKITSSLLKGPFPEAFDKLPIYGRIKVVQTQIIKCHYYAHNKQNEKLNQSLDELYSEYNVLLKRMISLAEENEIPLDSLGIDLPTIQDSRMKPALSKK